MNILEAGVWGVPNLSDLPKATLGVCDRACVRNSPLPFSSLITKDRSRAGRQDYIYPTELLSVLKG